MEQQRFKLAEHIHPDDILQVCGIAYEVTMTMPRLVGREEKYIQVFARVQGAQPTENTDLTIVFPLGALVKVKTRKKPKV